MKTRNVHGGGTTHCVDRLTSRKAQAALALAVSLWIANGGVASADEQVSADKTVDANESGTTYILCPKAGSDGSKGSGVTFTVADGGTVKKIDGQMGGSNGNTVIIEAGGTVEGDGNGQAIIGGVSNNEVTIAGTVHGYVYGGAHFVPGGKSTNNHVVVTGTGTDTLMVGSVYGGWGDTATNNTVEIRDAHVGGVCGGMNWYYNNSTTNNTVVLHNATVDGGVIGGTKVDVTGNMLILSGVNTAGNQSDHDIDIVMNFASIEFDASKLTWNTTAPVLTSKWGFNKCGVLDVSGVQSIVGTNSGTMTLLKTEEWFNPPQEVAYTGTNGKTKATLSAESPVTVQSTAKTAGADGVTIGYNNTHSVVRDDTNKAINYTVANTVNSITLGSIAWNAGGTVFDGTGYDFATNAVSWGLDNIKNLTFTFADEAAYKSLAPNATMTLISNATGIHGASAGPNPTFDYKVANGAALNTKVWGQLYVGDDPFPSYENTLTYKIDYVDIESVNLADWDSTKDAFAIPNGWNPRGNASTPFTDSPVSVTAAGFTAPTIDAGTSTNIITTGTANFFSNDKITGALKYTAQAASTDTAKGVALTGSESKGVKASDDGKNLVYARSNFNVSDISLGEMTWGEGRALTGGYDFANVNFVNAENLKFTNPDAVTGSGTLLSGASNLATGDNIAHTQNFTKDANGATLSATLSGNVIRTTANEIGYTATGTTLNSVNLAGWNGTASAVPTGWTANAAGVPVTAAGFAAPTLGAGTSTNILTTSTENFFSDSQISGALKYAAQAASSDTEQGVTLTGSESKGVKAADDGKNLVYERSNFNVSDISLGEMTWGTPREATTSYDFAGVTNINAANLKFTNPDAVTGSGTLLTGATNLATGDSIAHTQNFTKDANGATLSATLSGNVTWAAGAIGYTATDTTLNSVNLAGWNGTASAIPTGWTANAAGVPVTAAGFTAPTIDAGTAKDILTTTTENFFSDDKITGALKYKEYAASSETLSGVTLTGSESKGVKASTDGKNLVYARSNKNISNISFGTMEWDMSLNANDGYNYTNANIDLSKFTFSNPENISAGGTTTLLVANDTLAAIAATEKNVSYAYSPVAGVTVNGTVNGSYMTESNAVKYKATTNSATKLTFGNVAWTGGDETTPGTPLMTRPTNISFAGANVDTSNINFTNISELEANKEMTLVAGWDGAVGTITGSKYKVGSTLQGEGKASLEGSNLIFRTETTAEKMEVQEQTHNTVMGAEVGMAALAAGNDFIGAATEGLSLASNVGADGISSFATMGGGSMRQETGSHIDVRTWNAILALGHANKKERGTMEYGAFFEYGSGNYTTHNGDERGDGSTHYTGGGLLAKWTARHGLYVEGSLRAGSVHDDARNVLRDANGAPYSYETDAPYLGFHLGVGKEFTLANGNVVDVYGKYFYNRRNGVDFNAGGHYDLDAVTSSVIRLGARYTLKREKWSFYGGVAYEHELDGKANGTADGVAIRGADTSGASFRGELGATVTPDKNVPLTLDFNVTGFAGTKQGLSGGVSVSLMF